MHAPPWNEFDASVEKHATRLDPQVRKQLEAVLYLDMTSEYDARHYSAYVHSLDLEFTPAFLEMEREWAVDEELHFEGFRRVHEHGFGWGTERFEELEARTPDFAPLAHLFADEFHICCLGAYDELATVRAYRANLPLYDRLGPEFGRFLRRVVADEGRHFARFLRVLRQEHAHRAGEGASVLAKLRAADAIPYAQTFVLDHDDEVWTEAMFEEAAAVLGRRLSSMNERARPAQAKRA